MNCLILFSGTGSFSKVMKKKKYKNNFLEIRTLDLNNHFKPTYNKDVLKWNYKEELKDYKIHYLHSSPVCKDFSPLHNNKRKKGMKVDYRLIDKTIEIIEWIKNNNNPDLKFTIENPKGNMRHYERLKDFNIITTSYCKYRFKYQKNTDFFYGGFELDLKKECSKKGGYCDFRKEFNYHRVRIGVSRTSKTHKLSGSLQIPDNEYFKKKRKKEKYKGYTNEYFRFRIPKKLIKDIINCLIN